MMNIHETGQVFYADYAKPADFCDEAWKAIYLAVFFMFLIWRSLERSRRFSLLIHGHDHRVAEEYAADDYAVAFKSPRP